MSKRPSNLLGTKTSSTSLTRQSQSRTCVRENQFGAQRPSAIERLRAAAARSTAAPVTPVQPASPPPAPCAAPSNLRTTPWSPNARIVPSQPAMPRRSCPTNNLVDEKRPPWRAGRPKLQTSPEPCPSRRAQAANARQSLPRPVAKPCPPSRQQAASTRPAWRAGLPPAHQRNQQAAGARQGIPRPVASARPCPPSRQQAPNVRQGGPRSGTAVRPCPSGQQVATARQGLPRPAGAVRPCPTGPQATMSRLGLPRQAGAVRPCPSGQQVATARQGLPRPAGAVRPCPTGPQATMSRLGLPRQAGAVRPCPSGQQVATARQGLPRPVASTRPCPPSGRQAVTARPLPRPVAAARPCPPSGQRAPIARQGLPRPAGAVKPCPSGQQIATARQGLPRPVASTRPCPPSGRQAVTARPLPRPVAAARPCPPSGQRAPIARQGLPRPAAASRPCPQSRQPSGRPCPNVSQANAARSTLPIQRPPCPIARPRPEGGRPLQRTRSQTTTLSRVLSNLPSVSNVRQPQGNVSRQAGAAASRSTTSRLRPPTIRVQPPPNQSRQQSALRTPCAPKTARSGTPAHSKTAGLSQGITRPRPVPMKLLSPNEQEHSWGSFHSPPSFSTSLSFDEHRNPAGLMPPQPRSPFGNWENPPSPSEICENASTPTNQHVQPLYVTPPPPERSWGSFGSPPSFSEQIEIGDSPLGTPPPQPPCPFGDWASPGPISPVPGKFTYRHIPPSLGARRDMPVIYEENEDARDLPVIAGPVGYFTKHTVKPSKMKKRNLPRLREEECVVPESPEMLHSDTFVSRPGGDRYFLSQFGLGEGEQFAHPSIFRDLEWDPNDEAFNNLVDERYIPQRHQFIPQINIPENLPDDMLLETSFPTEEPCTPATPQNASDECLDKDTSQPVLCDVSFGSPIHLADIPVPECPPEPQAESSLNDSSIHENTLREVIQRFRRLTGRAETADSSSSAADCSNNTSVGEESFVRQILQVPISLNVDRTQASPETPQLSESRVRARNAFMHSARAHRTLYESMDSSGSSGTQSIEESPMNVTRRRPFRARAKPRRLNFDECQGEPLDAVTMPEDMMAESPAREPMEIALPEVADDQGIADISNIEMYQSVEEELQDISHPSLCNISVGSPILPSNIPPSNISPALPPSNICEENNQLEESALSDSYRQMPSIARRFRQVIGADSSSSSSSAVQDYSSSPDSPCDMSFLGPFAVPPTRRQMLASPEPSPLLEEEDQRRRNFIGMAQTQQGLYDAGVISSDGDSEVPCSLIDDSITDNRRRSIRARLRPRRLNFDECQDESLDAVTMPAEMVATPAQQPMEIALPEVADEQGIADISNIEMHESVGEELQDISHPSLCNVSMGSPIPPSHSPPPNICEDNAINDERLEESSISDSYRYVPEIARRFRQVIGAESSSSSSSAVQDYSSSPDSPCDMSFLGPFAVQPTRRQMLASPEPSPLLEEEDERRRNFVGLSRTHRSFYDAGVISSDGESEGPCSLINDSINDTMHGAFRGRARPRRINFDAGDTERLDNVTMPCDQFPLIEQSPELQPCVQDTSMPSNLMENEPDENMEDISAPDLCNISPASPMAFVDISSARPTSSSSMQDSSGSGSVYDNSFRQQFVLQRRQNIPSPIQSPALDERRRQAQSMFGDIAARHRAANVDYDSGASCPESSVEISGLECLEGAHNVNVSSILSDSGELIQDTTIERATVSNGEVHSNKKEIVTRRDSCGNVCREIKEFRDGVPVANRTEPGRDYELEVLEDGGVLFSIQEVERIRNQIRNRLEEAGPIYDRTVEIIDRGGPSQDLERIRNRLRSQGDIDPDDYEVRVLDDGGVLYSAEEVGRIRNQLRNRLEQAGPIYDPTVEIIDRGGPSQDLERIRNRLRSQRDIDPDDHELRVIDDGGVLYSAEEVERIRRRIRSGLPDPGQYYDHEVDVIDIGTGFYPAEEVQRIQNLVRNRLVDVGNIAADLDVSAPVEPENLERSASFHSPQDNARTPPRRSRSLSPRRTPASPECLMDMTPPQLASPAPPECLLDETPPLLMGSPVSPRTPVNNTVCPSNIHAPRRILDRPEEEPNPFAHLQIFPNARSQIEFSPPSVERPRPSPRTPQNRRPHSISMVAPRAKSNWAATYDTASCRRGLDYDDTPSSPECLSPPAPSGSNAVAATAQALQLSQTVARQYAELGLTPPNMPEMGLPCPDQVATAPPRPCPPTQPRRVTKEPYLPTRYYENTLPPITEMSPRTPQNRIPQSISMGAPRARSELTAIYDTTPVRRRLDYDDTPSSPECLSPESPPVASGSNVIAATAQALQLSQAVARQYAELGLTPPNMPEMGLPCPDQVATAPPRPCPPTQPRRVTKEPYLPTRYYENKLPAIAELSPQSPRTPQNRIAHSISMGAPRARSELTAIYDTTPVRRRLGYDDTPSSPECLSPDSPPAASGSNVLAPTAQALQLSQAVARQYAELGLTPPNMPEMGLPCPDQVATAPPRPLVPTLPPRQPTIPYRPTRNYEHRLSEIGEESFDVERYRDQIQNRLRLHLLDANENNIANISCPDLVSSVCSQPSANRSGFQQDISDNALQLHDVSAPALHSSDPSQQSCLEDVSAPSFLSSSSSPGRRSRSLSPPRYPIASTPRCPRLSGDSWDPPTFEVGSLDESSGRDFFPQPNFDESLFRDDPIDYNPCLDQEPLQDTGEESCPVPLSFESFSGQSNNTCDRGQDVSQPSGYISYEQVEDATIPSLAASLESTQEPSDTSLLQLPPASPSAANNQMDALLANLNNSQNLLDVTPPLLSSPRTPELQQHYERMASIANNQMNAIIANLSDGQDLMDVTPPFSGSPASPVLYQTPATNTPPTVPHRRHDRSNRQDLSSSVSLEGNQIFPRATRNLSYSDDDQPGAAHSPRSSPIAQRISQAIVPLLPNQQQQQQEVQYIQDENMALPMPLQPSTSMQSLSRAALNLTMPNDNQDQNYYMEDGGNNQFVGGHSAPLLPSVGSIINPQVDYEPLTLQSPVLSPIKGVQQGSVRYVPNTPPTLHQLRNPPPPPDPLGFNTMPNFMDFEEMIREHTPPPPSPPRRICAPPPTRPSPSPCPAEQNNQSQNASATRFTTPPCPGNRSGNPPPSRNQPMSRSRSCNPPPARRPQAPRSSCTPVTSRPPTARSCNPPASRQNAPTRPNPSRSCGPPARGSNQMQRPAPASRPRSQSFQANTRCRPNNRPR